MLSFLRKKIEFDKYWIQEVPVKQIAKRTELFFPLCENKTVIHFGCTDYPIFRPNQNLHIQLSKITKSLHGFDIDLEGIKVLQGYVDQPYFSNFEDIKDLKYDVCLIPETIEHVDNVRQFLENLRYVNADKFIITAPNCFSNEHIKRNTLINGVYSEIVHPDHNCWYSPFTLKNVIEKYAPLKVNKVYLLEQDTMVCCEAELK